MASNKTAAAEEMAFETGPEILWHTIQSQSGTIGKAFLEGIMNSVDAKATYCDITIDKSGYTIVDDGHGFRSRKEIIDNFRVFCFKHDTDPHNQDRVYGKFGMGRGQLWSWSSAVWRTGQFSMDVDIKNRGLKFILKDGLDPVNGLHITGKFYEPLFPSDQESAIREIKELAKYAQIRVKVNGQLISTPAKGQKWTYETDDAYILIKEGLSYLSVYNLGVLVRKYNAYQAGCGGTVVSKRSLDLNFARNDIMMSKCQVWRRIKKYLQKKTEDRVKKKTQLTDDERQNRIDAMKTGDAMYNDVRTLKLIIDTTGRKWDLKHFESGVKLLTVEPEEGSQMAEVLHLRKIAFVLAKRTLYEFDVDNERAFVALLKKIVGKDYYFSNLQTVPFETVSKTVNNGRVVLDDKKDMTLREQLALRAIKKAEHYIPRVINWAGYHDDLTSRKLKIGVAEISQAWTDGENTIVLHRDNLKLADRGTAGFFIIAARLVHEYLHTKADTDSHSHDQAFYQNYHDTMMYHDRYDIAQVAIDMEREYIKQLQENGAKLKKAQLTSMDTMTKLEGLVPAQKPVVVPSPVAVPTILPVHVTKLKIGGKTFAAAAVRDLFSEQNISAAA